MILVSACLANKKCRYNGEAATDRSAVRLVEEGRAITACPEVLGGLSIPRDPCEIVPGGSCEAVITNKGLDVSEAFINGARKTLELSIQKEVRYAILKERSPSCGFETIYNGEFNSTLVKGNGITTRLLLEHGIKVYRGEDAPYEKIKVYDYLDSLNIHFEIYKHPPIFTVEQAKELEFVIEGQQCKNLFLRNRNGNSHYLVIVPQDVPFDIKEMEKSLNLSRLSFGSKDRLEEMLGVLPGSVGGFGLINDKNLKVEVLVSKGFDTRGDITFHPNVNDETLKISFKDFEKFVQATGHKIQFI